MWRLTSLLIACYMGWGATKLMRMHDALNPVRRTGLIVFHLAVLATQLVNLSGYGAAPQPGWVLLGLVGCLGLAGWHFYRLVRVPFPG
ncbi:MAG: hypothetical protein ACQGVC_02880 [Myxococcota bacterium]